MDISKIKETNKLWNLECSHCKQLFFSCTYLTKVKLTWKQEKLVWETSLFPSMSLTDANKNN